MTSRCGRRAGSQRHAAEQRDFFHWLSALIVHRREPRPIRRSRFFSSAWTALRARGRPNMDVPICDRHYAGIGNVAVRDRDPRRARPIRRAIMLIAFLLAGRYLDQNMRRRTRGLCRQSRRAKAETREQIHQ